MKGIGVLPGDRISYVDHIVPLCQMMEIPLLCTDRWIYEMIDLHYPEMQLVYDEAPDFCLDHALEGYDTLFYVDLFRKPHGFFHFYEYVYSGKARSVCAQHGNSDKKRNVFWAENHADEDIVLLDGQHMVDFMQEKQVLDRIPRCILAGNFRLEYYRQNKAFLDQKMRLPKDGRKTILYAPTWTSPNNRSDWRCDYSSFLEVHEAVIEGMTDDYRLIIKLHPTFLRFFSEEAREIKEKYEDRAQILFLDDIPLIYPLLEQVDIYLGDYSSIGYDFLAYNRPLFFLNMNGRDSETDSGVHLYRCGKAIGPDELRSVCKIIEETDSSQFEKARLETYAYAFGKERKSLSQLREEIEGALSE